MYANNNVLFIGCYILWFDRTHFKVPVVWRCSKRPLCKVQVIQSGGLFLEGKHLHSHGANGNMKDDIVFRRLVRMNTGKFVKKLGILQRSYNPPGVMMCMYA